MWIPRAIVDRALLSALFCVATPAAAAIAPRWSQYSRGSGDIASVASRSGDSEAAQGDFGATRQAISAQFVGRARFLLQNTYGVLTSPVRWGGRDRQRFSLLTATVVSVGFADQPIRILSQRNRTRTVDHVVEAVEPLGAGYAVGALGGGFFMAGAMLADSQATAVAWDGLASMLIASQIITPALKEAVGRYRPFQSLDADKFDPFSGHSSFPSGHATRAFSVASVIAAHYDPLWVKATAYGLTGMVAFARVNRNVHFASDVVAGSLIGTTVGRAVVHRGQRRETETASRPRITSWFFSDGSGVIVTMPLYQAAEKGQSMSF
ncbi:MAG: phosphatase PAP2 family protein [Candidatus Zixiibacteriota bacterium]